MSNNDDIQWLESYLRYGYDPEVQRFEDNNMAYFQANPYFALPPPSQMSHPSPGTSHTRFQPPYPQGRPSAERTNVRPTGVTSSSAPAPFPAQSRPPQAPPRYAPPSTGAPPPVSQTQGSQVHFLPARGPESYQNLAQQALYHSQRAPSPQPPQPTQPYPPATTAASAAPAATAAPAAPAPPPTKTAPPQPRNTGSPQLLNPTQTQLPNSAPPRAPQSGPPTGPPRAWTTMPDGNRTASSAAPGRAPPPTSKTVPPEAQRTVHHPTPKPMPSPPAYSAPPQNPPVSQATGGFNQAPTAGSFTAPSQGIPQNPPVNQNAGGSNQNSSAAPYRVSPQTLVQNLATSQHTGGPYQGSAAGPQQTPSHSMPKMPQPGGQPAPAPAPGPAPSQVIPQKQKFNASTGPEPGNPAKKRRVEPPKTSQQPASVAFTNAAHPSIPLGGLSAFSYSPATTPGLKAKDYLKHRADIVKPIDEADAARKLAYDPKTIARDVLIASGRHPTEEALNHHLFRLRDVFTHVENGSDLATFRWDLVDSHEARDQGRTGAPLPPSNQPSAPRPAPPHLNFPSVPVPPSSAQPQQALPPNPEPRVQLSQPPPSAQISFQSPSPQVQHPPRTGGPSHLHPPYTPLPPQPQSQPQSRSPPKTPASAMVGKRGPGRPPGSGNKPKQQPVPTTSAQPVEYQVFGCQWTNCRARLHNLEGLKKHIFKVHVSQQLTCGWKGCTHPEPMPAALLFKHVKKDHLDSIAWRLGDGPSVPTPGEKASG
ncbi:hypothetical protein BP00DRAFT_148528 [Aspergillus indologenus CBS 114.80]|uniref:C2H2-type domain-containing protein n=1 Tax=Aspergillus indologenus CBS 114.80 TaxID=1450541 RepID=A0A2V5I775_9EURO|nr:hypothetical protein BP00DRAFT_148528 [Aspergillus indologenus CBS 114.80]